MTQKNTPTLLVLNGPNLNMLGQREPALYGTETLTDIEEKARTHARTLGFELDFYQSNNEGDLVDRIQAASGKYAALILNAGAFTHTSVAIFDALQLIQQPVIEVHLSNIFKRESFRHHSYVSPAAVGLICGFGGNSYILALDAAAHLLNKQ